MFYKIGVLEFFSKFTRKHLRRSLVLNKITGLYPATLLKEKTPIQVFSDECWKIQKPPGDCFCSSEKHFTTKIVKSPLEIAKKVGNRL